MIMKELWSPVTSHLLHALGFADVRGTALCVHSWLSRMGSNLAPLHGGKSVFLTGEFHQLWPIALDF